VTLDVLTNWQNGQPPSTVNTICTPP
jgi:hypothetical protein